MTHEPLKHIPNPTGGRGRKSMPPRQPFGIETRLKNGCLSPEEVANLANVSVKKIYYDAARGEIVLKKIGGLTRAPGWSASQYLGLTDAQ